MEVVRARSVPGNLRQVGGGLWPRVSTTVLCLEAETHPVYRKQSETSAYCLSIRYVSETETRNQFEAIRATQCGASTEQVCVGKLSESRDDLQSCRRAKFENASSDTSLKCLSTEQHNITSLPSGLQEGRSDKLISTRAGTGLVAQTRSRHCVETTSDVVNTFTAPTAYSEPRHLGALIKKDDATLQASRQVLVRTGLKRQAWADPHLSLGYKCNSLAGNKCWEAIGPAKEIFSIIAKSIGDLLDTRMDELGENEHIAGHILTFGMYMAGKDSSVARPMLLFICQSSEPRNRAIKLLKESEIMKAYAGVRLADTSAPPMASGRNYLELLSAVEDSATRNKKLSDAPSIVIFKRQPINGVEFGLEVGIPVGVAVVVLFILYAICLRRGRAARKEKSGCLEIDPPLRYTRLDINALELELRRTIPEPTQRARVSVASDATVSDNTSSRIIIADSDERMLQQRDELLLLPSRMTHIEGSLRNAPPPTHTGANTSLIRKSSDPPDLFNERNMVLHQLNARDLNNTMSQVMVYYSDQQRSNLSDAASRSFGYGGVGISVFSNSTRRHATIGGFVSHRGMTYGLTVAHVFENHIHMNVSEDESDHGTDCNEDFAFDEGDDYGKTLSVTSEENNILDVDVTSCFSTFSDEASTQRLSAVVSNSSSTESFSSVDEGSAVRSSLEKYPEEKKIGAMEEAMPQNGYVVSPVSGPFSAHVDEHCPSKASIQSRRQTDIATSSSSSHDEFGLLYMASTVDQNLGLDWSLVELSATTKAKCKNAVHGTKAFEAPRKVIPKILGDSPILVIRAGDCVTSGIISPCVAMMKFSAHSHFQQVWSVRLDTAFRKFCVWCIASLDPSNNQQNQATPAPGWLIQKVAIYMAMWLRASLEAISPISSRHSAYLMISKEN